LKFSLLAVLCLILTGTLCADLPVPVILDSDANNELDDQHAIAYLLLNPDHFETLAITVNRTRHGGGIDQHVAEARRMVALSGRAQDVPVIAGADAGFEEIEQAMQPRPQPLLLLPVGKLTNIALALAKRPEIASRVRVVWLGSNYPRPGEYNQENDEAALVYVLEQDVPFEMVTVRYNADSGTTVVRITPNESRVRVAGLGPAVNPPVTGRDGQAYRRVGDYLANLVGQAELYGDPPARSLFDMAAVAIVKNPGWAQSRTHPAPLLQNGAWRERPENPRLITVWEYFDREAILGDFYETLARSGRE
jgi:hypothetical protein